MSMDSKDSSVLSRFDVANRFDDADAFYQNLINAHQDLSETDSHRLNARLVLMMANQIGSNAILTDLLNQARVNLLQQKSK